MQAGLGLVFLACLHLPAEATAAPEDFPVLIRTVGVGAAGTPGAEWAMLQMTVDGQQGVSGETLDFYGPAGALTGSFELDADVANGQSHRTILLATAVAAPSLPEADFELPAGDALDPAAGALCLRGDFPADCAAWGSFPAATAAALPDPQASRAAAIAGAAAVLGRRIDAGCPTWLGPDDDAISSAGAFFDGIGAGNPPEPVPAGARNNAATPPAGVEACQQNTHFNEVPLNPTNDTTPTFAFGETFAEYGTEYRCAFAADALIDAEPFAPCPAAGNGYGPLADGLYTFRAFAIGYLGADPTPAEWTFEVDTVPPQTTIVSTPGPVSNGFAASFSFASSEANSSFVCRLGNRPVQVCTPGKTYFFLADGHHTFRVWAIDNATNQDPTPAEHVFYVDTAFGDVSPPSTEITAGPPRHSKDPAARFTYVSDEPGSSFQCRVDGDPFAPCPATGMSYPGLRNGRHVFQVRATDRAGNTDPSPDAHGWTIEGPLPETRFTKAPPGVVRVGDARSRARVRFAFVSSRAASRFRCRIDRRPFRSCRSPRRLKVGRGRHRFEVYAIDRVGNRDPSPARRIFRVLGRGAGKDVFGGGRRGRR